MYRSCRVLFVATVFALPPVGAIAQLDGGFSLSKTTYLAGEPVFLLFTVKNVGSQPVLVRTARPLSFCSGYQFDLKGARDRDANGCGPAGTGGSCASGGAILKPGETRTRSHEKLSQHALEWERRRLSPKSDCWSMPKLSGIPR